MHNEEEEEMSAVEIWFMFVSVLALGYAILVVS